MDNGLDNPILHMRPPLHPLSIVYLLIVHHEICTVSRHMSAQRHIEINHLNKILVLKYFAAVTKTNIQALKTWFYTSCMRGNKGK